jgi:hypothetical protein
VLRHMMVTTTGDDPVARGAFQLGVVVLVTPPTLPKIAPTVSVLRRGACSVDKPEAQALMLWCVRELWCVVFVKCAKKQEDPSPAAEPRSGG